MTRISQIVAGLDIGTAKITLIVAERDEKGGLDVIGIGNSPSKGLRKGVVVDMDATVESIKCAAEEAELMSGVSVGRAFVGTSGGHIRGFNSRGVVAITSRDHEITREDIRRVLHAARSVSVPQDREIFHALPQEFIVDDQGGIDRPLGMSGTRLEVNVYLVTGFVAAVQNLVNAVNRAGIEVEAVTLENLAAGQTVLSRDEREMGVGLVDIGGGTTDLAIFERGAIRHVYSLPSGGDHFTNDIAVGLRTPHSEAERIKMKYGCALPSLVPEDETIEVPSVGGRKPRVLSRQLLCEIIRPRADEILGLLREEIKRAGFESSLNAGLVFTGGGCLLDGITEIAEDLFDRPVRRGTPNGIGGLIDVVDSPAHATAVGLVVHGANSRRELKPAPWRQISLGRVTTRIRDWFQDFL
ncbi:MAG: cell division protein FtsA [Acidobacteria bacterium]|nr:cell division protein FtsA [Acidobacteriota bacterium]